MRRLEVSGAVRPIYGSLGVKRLKVSLPSSLLQYNTILTISTIYNCQWHCPQYLSHFDISRCGQVQLFRRRLTVGKPASPLTLILLTCRIWWAPNNASKWQMGFNSEFKGLIQSLYAVMFTDEAKIGNEYTYRKRRWKFILSIVSQVMYFAFF